MGSQDVMSGPPITLCKLTVGSLSFAPMVSALRCTVCRSTKKLRLSFRDLPLEYRRNRQFPLVHLA